MIGNFEGSSQAFSYHSVTAGLPTMHQLQVISFATRRCRDTDPFNVSEMKFTPTE
jgi:hypothetical protein